MIGERKEEVRRVEGRRKEGLETVSPYLTCKNRNYGLGNDCVGCQV